MWMTLTSSRMLWSIEAGGFYRLVSIRLGWFEHWNMVILEVPDWSTWACIYRSLFSGI